MPVSGFQLMSVRCLVTGKNADLKRQDGLSDSPGIIHFSHTGLVLALNGGKCRVLQDSN